MRIPSLVRIDAPGSRGGSMFQERRTSGSSRKKGAGKTLGEEAHRPQVEFEAAQFVSDDESDCPAEEANRFQSNGRFRKGAEAVRQQSPTLGRSAEPGVQCSAFRDRDSQWNLPPPADVAEIFLLLVENRNFHQRSGMVVCLPRRTIGTHSIYLPSLPRAGQVMHICRAYVFTRK